MEQADHHILADRFRPDRHQAGTIIPRQWESVSSLQRVWMELWVWGRSRNYPNLPSIGYPN